MLILPPTYWQAAKPTSLCSQPGCRSKASDCHFNTSFPRFDTASPLVQDKLAVTLSYQATVAAMVILSAGRLIGLKLTIDLCYVRTVLTDFSSVNPISTTAITNSFCDSNILQFRGKDCTAQSCHCETHRSINYSKTSQ